MKLKKVLVAILIITIILTLEASYLFTGSTPIQTTDTANQEPAPSSFVGPTGPPSVRGPQPQLNQ